MSNQAIELTIELGLLGLFGLLYYLYQRRKILAFEADKIPSQLGLILQLLLLEHDKNSTDPILNELIEEIDRFLHGETSHPPLALMKVYSENQPNHSPDLKRMIAEILVEINES